jgi:hypothetical protein
LTCPAAARLLLLCRTLKESSVVMVPMPVMHVCVAMCAVVMCIRHHGQQSNGAHTQQQHRKLGPASKRLGDVSPAAGTEKTTNRSSKQALSGLFCCMQQAE